MGRSRCLNTRRFLGKQPKTRSSGHKNLSKKNAKAHFAAAHTTEKVLKVLCRIK